MTTTFLNITLLQASSAPQGAGGASFWVMIVAIFAIMYFFMIRPQNKKQKEIQKFRNTLEVGQDVITIGGLHGTVKSINETDNTIVIKVSSSVELTFDKSAILPTGSKPGEQTK